MRISKGLAGISLIGYVAIIGLWTYGCNDKPTDPPPPEPPKDYAVYFADQTAPVCYGYRVVSGLLDTIALPFIAAMGLDVSPDGSTLYVAGLYEVAAVDVTTGDSDVIWSEGACNGVTVSPDGRYLALHCEELNILDLGTLALIHRETEPVFRGVFAADGGRFYAPTEQCQILEVNLEGTGAVSRTSIPDRCYGRIAVSADDRRWYLYDMGPCYGRFEVYDVAVDSLVFSDYFHPGLGYLELVPDEGYALFTNPGPAEDFCSQYVTELSISVYDIGGNRLVDGISTRNIQAPVNGVDSTLVIELTATPDNRWLVGLSLRGDIVLVDLEQLEITRFSRFDVPRPIVRYPCCQAGL